MDISTLLSQYLSDNDNGKNKLIQLRQAITEALNDEQDYASTEPEWKPVRLLMRDDKVGGGYYGDSNKPIHDLSQCMAYIKQQNEIISEQATAGFILISSFEEGATLTLSNEVLLFEQDGQYYRWTGVLPKVVDANSTPESTGGVIGGAWVLVGDGALRTELKLNTGAGIVGTESGKSVEQSLQNLKKNITDIEPVILDNSQNLNLTISEQIRVLSKQIKDEVMAYDAFGNTIFFDNLDLFCFYRSVSHYTTADSKSKVCIAKRDQSGITSIIWEIESDEGIGYRDPKLTPDLASNRLILSYQIFDVVQNKYENSIIGFVDLNNTGKFLSSSKMTANDYFLWGNVIRNPEGAYLATRYNRNNQNIQLIKSSDTNLDDLTQWLVVKEFSPSDFANKTGINEVCIGLFKNKLVAVFRTMSSDSGLSTIGFARTNDLTGKSGWVTFNLDAALAGPYIEAYNKNDSPLIIVGASNKNGTRSQIKIIITHDCINFLPAIDIQNLNTFNAYASVKQRNHGVYDLLTFDEKVQSNSVTQIHTQTFFLEKTKAAKNELKTWRTSFITRPTIGDISVVNSWVNSRQLFIAFNTKVNGIIGVQIAVGPMKQPLTATPALYFSSGSLMASFKAVTISSSDIPQIINIYSNAPNINFSTFDVLKLDFGTELPVGAFNTSKNSINYQSIIPFNLFNNDGLSGSEYLLCSLITA